MQNARLQPFVRKWRAAPGAGNPPRAYVVSADISRAFDHIDVDRLLAVVEPLLQAPEYVIIKYVEVRWEQSSLEFV